MEDIKFGNLVLAALFGLPGYLFVLIVTQYSFNTARGSGARTVRFLSSFVFSTLLVLLFDSSLVQEKVSALISAQVECGPPTYLRHLIGPPQFVSSFLNPMLTNKVPNNFAWIAVAYLFWMSALAFVCAAVISGALRFLVWYSRVNSENYIAIIFYRAEYIVRRFGSYSARFKKLSKVLVPAPIR
ncbi:MAG: hypothetical protein EOP06_20800, partial [Proteobacteria bacterium]